MRPLTDYPLDAEDIQAIHDHGDAMDRGDREAARAAFRRLKIDPWTLWFLKKRRGADYIREAGYNTTLADQEFGPDWLDRED